MGAHGIEPETSRVKRSPPFLQTHADPRRRIPPNGSVGRGVLQGAVPDWATHLFPTTLTTVLSAPTQRPSAHPTYPAATEGSAVLDRSVDNQRPGTTRTTAVASRTRFRARSS